MNYTKRTLVAIAGLSVLATSAQAVITITPLDSTVKVPFQNEASILPSQLSEGVTGIGTITPDMGSFDISSTTGLTGLKVGEVHGLAVEGLLSLTVWLDGTTILYSDATSSNNPLVPSSGLYSFNGGTSTHVVSYEATWTGNAPWSVGALGKFTVDGFEAVPEPAPVAVMSVGVIGLIARKRRSSK